MTTFFQEIWGLGVNLGYSSFMVGEVISCYRFLLSYFTHIYGSVEFLNLSITVSHSSINSSYAKIGKSVLMPNVKHKSSINIRNSS